MNAIRAIAPYRFSGHWVFDDPAVGLDKEPFVAGADTLIDMATAHIPDASEGFVLLFSDGQFPGASIELQRVREEFGGHWYRAPQWNAEGWLCPALFKYFEAAPERIYVQVKPKA